MKWRRTLGEREEGGMGEERIDGVIWERCRVFLYPLTPRCVMETFPQILFPPQPSINEHLSHGHGHCHLETLSPYRYYTAAWPFNDRSDAVGSAAL